MDTARRYSLFRIAMPNDNHTPSANRFRFRAWDKDAGTRGLMAYDISLEFLAKQEGLVVPHLNVALGRAVKNGLILMQSTGLVDKNGKDIFEGDIIRAFDANYEVKTVVTDSHYYVDYGYSRKHNGPAPHWIEVIGNIYENPDLLPKS